MGKKIAVIGAGGKTTLIHRLRDRYLSEGKKVLVTTTTHMLIEEDTDLSCDAATIREKLKEGYVMAGKECGVKMEALPKEIQEEIFSDADLVLMEADGAKHHSIKVPADYEPQVPKDTDEVILVLGLMDLGKTVKEAVFRYELLEESLWEERLSFSFIRDVITAKNIENVRNHGYDGNIKVLYTDILDGRLEYMTAAEAGEKYE